MDIGITMFPTDYSIRIDDLAREAEARGFESLFVPEHTHIPASRRSPWPGGPELPREYWHTLDPFVGLAAAAAVTTWLRLGTGIALLTERDPILTAKESATVDLLSDGRFELGIGGGVERGGDGTPRHGVQGPFQGDDGPCVGDQDHLDAGGAAVPRRLRRLRPDSGHGRSRCSGRTLRSCSGARAGTRCAGLQSISTAGCRGRGAASMRLRRWRACGALRRRRSASPRS